LPEHLAGRDLTRAKLPDEIAKFPALAQVKEISADARKVFIGLLAACVYSWLVIGTTTDLALILNTVSSPLPIINTPIPIASVYVIGAALLAAVYCYFHFYLQRLWRTLATLPAFFPDGTPLDDKTDPWLLTNLVRANFKELRRSPPPLARLENLLTILLAWWLVPLTILALWARYLPAHYWLGTAWLVALFGVTAVFGRHSYRLARATLRGETPAAAGEADDGRGVSRRAWHELRQIRPDRLTVGLTAAVALCSLSAFRDNPQDPHTWLAKLLNTVGIRTFADLREANVAMRPEGWTGKEWDKVKRVDLRGRNLAFADATGAFLANIDLRGADLQGVVLWGAELQGANLTDAKLQDANLTSAKLQAAALSYAQLQGADLSSAELQGADLSFAELQGANLTDAKLQGADLSSAELQRAQFHSTPDIPVVVFGEPQLQGALLHTSQLQGANLTSAKLKRADLTYGQLQGADLQSAWLQGADLSFAELQGANLHGAWLQGADLTGAELQGADLTGSGVWRGKGWGEGTSWPLADLRGSWVAPMADSEIDTLISEATGGIPDQKRRKAAAERLNAGLRTAERPARPDFPQDWRSEPNVMFNQNDPRHQPFDWGQPKWAAERAYDGDLANFLGDLACRGAQAGVTVPFIPETVPRIPTVLPASLEGPKWQAEGLARRAIETVRADELHKEWAGSTIGFKRPVREVPNRTWPVLFAKQVTGVSCSPAKELPDDVRRQLEQLAARGDASAASSETSPPDSAE
jgi:uncharacterized protein YjbI with pentapeptide repeats